MRNPNGYGGITKLKGNRRKPWMVRVTDHWELDEENEKNKQVYRNIGYFATRKEAMQALADYNAGKPVIETDKQVNRFGTVYEEWLEHYSKDLKPNSIQNHRTGYNPLRPLENRDISKITLKEIELVMANSGKSAGILTRSKVVLSNVYKYAYAHGMVTVDQVSAIDYLDVSRIATAKVKERPHEIFTADEINTLWEHQSDEMVQIYLVLIYTGLRANELLQNPKENWHDDYIEIKESKTAAGVRSVPIAEKIKPIYLQLRDKKLPSYNFMSSKFDCLPTEKRHTLHDTRHTCTTLLVNANIDDRVVKMILGHSGDITMKYTHADMEIMREAINKI